MNPRELFRAPTPIGRIIIATAAYREHPADLERLSAIAGAARIPMIVLADRDDLYDHVIGASAFRKAGPFQRERHKRNALLELVRAECGPMQDNDWILSIDPDEIPLHLEALPAILRELDPFTGPAYPLPRLEENGTVWAMPCKCFRGTVNEYVYLDTHVRWGDHVWDLDPWVTTAGGIIPGWPALSHHRSRRSSTITAGAETFYTDTIPIDPGAAKPAIYPKGLRP